MPESRQRVEALRQTYADGDETEVHSHDRHQLTYAERGVLAVTVEESRWIVPPLRAIWIPAGVPHRIRAHGPTDIRPVYIDASMGPAELNQITVVSVSSLLRALIEELHDPILPTSKKPASNQSADNQPSTKKPDHQRSNAERHHLEALFVLQLERLSSTPLRLPILNDPRLAAIHNALVDRPNDRRTLRAWGRFCGASERTLVRLFASEAGTTFGHWRTQLRLQHALIRLASGNSVTTTAHACGYNSTSAFIEAFRSALGTTPGKYFDEESAPPTISV